MRRFGLTLLLASCVAPSTSAPSTGAVASSIDQAADEAGVPRELLRAIAIEERGIDLDAQRVVDEDDNVPVAGRLELRHGRLDTLAMGASMMGVSEDALVTDTDLATRAGARVLAALGATYGGGSDWASWRRALEVLSGMDDANAHDYASRVLALLSHGGSFASRSGEVIALDAHPEIDPAETVETKRAYLDTPDYPGAIWFTTSCTNKCTVGRPLGNAAVDKIVIHDTEGGWDGSVATLQNDSGKSVHYIVDADGSRVGQFRSEGDTTWHAGNYYYNETSIGIEHVGVASDPTGYSDGLYAKSRDLVGSIRSRWTVPLDRTHIIGHYQVPDGNVIAEASPPCTDTLDNCENSANYGGANNHRDPGYYWQWCQYMEHLGGSCTCNDAWPLWNCTTDHTEAVRCSNGVVEIDQCPGGCDVQPVGTDDVCHTDATGGPDAAPGTGPDGSVAGAGPDGGAPGDNLSGGCCSTSGGGGGSVVLALAVFGLVARRRR